MRLLSAITLCLIVTAMLCTITPSSLAQDAVTADAGHHKVEFENDQVRVVRYSIAPHDKTAEHSHPNGVQIMLTDHNGRITTPDGKTTEVHGKAGTAVWRGPTTHIVENIGDKPIEGILVEPKNKGSAGPLVEAKDPAKLDPQHEKIEFENEQVRVLRYHFNPGDKAPMHDHPNNVQVALTDYDGRITTAEGKSTSSAGKAGEVHWRTATTHTVENVGSTPYEGILVELKGGGAAASR
jgi:beta-alanine degradation protein BauB